MSNVLLLDLISGISGALDHVSPAVTGHHRRVGLACALVGKSLGLSREELTDLHVAGQMHDIGAFSLDFALDGLDFDADLTEHAGVGHRLLRTHPQLQNAAEFIRHHHTPWKDLQDDGVNEKTAFLGNVVNLLDRVDILARVGVRTFDRERIRDVAADYSSTIYAPEAVAAFLDASKDDAFWEAMMHHDGHVRDIMGDLVLDQRIPQDELLAFAQLFSHIIDFRSRHTATHSQGVAETAAQLAKLAGMNSWEQRRMRLAGNLHDIGKLAVSSALIEKPAALEPDEFVVVKNHASVCEDVLNSIPGLEDVAAWACQHHERVNGKGYPHGLSGDELSLGSRIMAVADVFTAVTEDRPYRAGMPPEKARSALSAMAQKGYLDARIVELALENYDMIDAIRTIAQSRALDAFKRFSRRDSRPAPLRAVS